MTSKRWPSRMPFRTSTALVITVTSCSFVNVRRSAVATIVSSSTTRTRPRRMLGGVDEKVQEDLAEAGIVPERDRGRLGIVLHQPRAVADLVPRHVRRRVQHLVHVDRTGLEVLRLRERLEVAHDRADPLGPVERLAHDRAKIVEAALARVSAPE